MKEGTYIVLHAWMRNELNLKGNHLFIYAMIYGFSMDGKTEYSGGLSYAQECAGCSKNTAIKVLAELTEKQLILRREEVLNGVKFVKYRANLTTRPKTAPGWSRNCTGGGAEIGLGGGAEIAPNKDTYLERYKEGYGKDKADAIPNSDLNSKIGKKQTEALKKAGAKNCDPELRKKIIDWLGYRREIGKPLTARSISSLIKTWSALPRAQLSAAIKHSIDNGYQGLFYDKFNQDGTPRSASPKMHSQPTFGHSEETSRRFREMANS